MRVQELAKDLGVEANALIALFRQMGIPVSGARSVINEAQQAKVLAKIERERRAGHSDPATAIQAVLEEALPAPSRRRRRRRRILRLQPSLMLGWKKDWLMGKAPRWEICLI